MKGDYEMVVHVQPLGFPADYMNCNDNPDLPLKLWYYRLFVTWSNSVVYSVDLLSGSYDQEITTTSSRAQTEDLIFLK